MRLLQIMTIAFFFGLTISCGGGGTTTPETTTDSTAVTTTQPTAPTKVELIWNYLGKTDFDAPQNEIVLKVDGKEQKIDTILACDVIAAADYQRHEIPATAVSACGGWWAGGGDYFYAIIENNQAVVYQGWQDEGQEDVGFHWTKMNLNLK